MHFFEEVGEDEKNEGSDTTSPTANENRLSTHILTSKVVLEETPLDAGELDN